MAINIEKLKQQIKIKKLNEAAGISSIQKPKAPVADNAAFIGDEDDRKYVYMLKKMFGDKYIVPYTNPMEMLTHFEMFCSHNHVKYVATTNVNLLKKLVALRGEVSNPTLDNYAGSFFEYKGIEIVFLNPLRQLQTIPYGKFICERNISKLVRPDKWPEPTLFSYCLATSENVEHLYNQFKYAALIATDIETSKTNLAINCIGYTAVFFNNLQPYTVSCTLPMDSMWAVYWMRKFNKLSADKIFQNGKYDNAYLLRYNSVPVNWFWDTATMFHSLYSELPKDLAFQNAFWLRKVIYWKDLSKTNDKEQYFRYCALDTWATANVALQWFMQAPDWAKRNYFLEFPLNFPCLLSEMTGLIRDQDKLVSTRKEMDVKQEKYLNSLRKMVNVSTYNPGSPQQTIKVMRIFGDSEATSSDEKHVNKFAIIHPINARFAGVLKKYRSTTKIITSYLRLDSDKNKETDEKGGAKEYKGFWLYSLVPHGTDTARLSSGEHAFWCGQNVQNVSSRNGPEVKQTVKAPEGFYIGESDLEQAETRDTAHIAGEENLIKNVSGPHDFHSLNTSQMSGLPYHTIYDDDRKKTLNKKLRDLFKRVNHGANYNMGANTLVDTMGVDKVWEAQSLLKLSFVSPKAITQYLLDKFHETYPALRKYYDKIVYEVTTTNRITSRAYHHTAYNLANFEEDKYIRSGDWTRYCFGDPTSNKLILNSYVAHPPQSLNSRTLNEAYMEVFYKVALPHAADFRLNAQIHDSILFCWRKGCYDLPAKVRKIMEIPLTVLGTDGKKRTFTVPAALKIGKQAYDAVNRPVVDDFGNEVIEYAKYWSETE
jgi:DNA polymerase I-like protein with 3'-5' exonuclease and polymerase domains